ncbi:MAG: translation initiation factor IF-2, partial [Hydrogenophilales bacterium 17-61-9]
MNVEQFAQELKLPPELLLEQLKAAGVSKNDVVDSVTEADKAHLLDYLRKMHGGGAETGKTKITITRKQTGEIRKTDSTGKSRTIQVEVRKSRTFVKRDASAPTAEARPVAESGPETPSAPEFEEQIQPEIEAKIEAPTPEPVAEPVAAEPVEVKPEPVIAETPAVVAPVPATEAETAIAEVAAAPADAPVPVVKKTTRIKKASILGDAEVKARADETRRHQALLDRQAADRAQRESLRKQAEAAQAAREAAKLAEAIKAAAPPAPAAPTEKTLHKPDKPTGSKPDKKPAKKAEGSWKDDAAKRKGALKTRGGAAPDTGWRGRKGKSRSGSSEETTFIAPTEPVVREVLVPETI